jgi:hypothetical protein
VCEPALGEDCNSCPSDCAGQTGGTPEDRYCCGDDVACSDSRCTDGGFICLLDFDGDGVSDPKDNCYRRENGPGTAGFVADPRGNGSYQCDDDLDGFGNRCDCDFDQSGWCDSTDEDALRAKFGDPVDSSNAIFDLDCDQKIGWADLGFYGNVAGGSGEMGLAGRRSDLPCADPTVPPPGNCPSPFP